MEKAILVMNVIISLGSVFTIFSLWEMMFCPELDLKKKDWGIIGAVWLLWLLVMIAMEKIGADVLSMDYPAMALGAYFVYRKLGKYQWKKFFYYWGAASMWLLAVFAVYFITSPMNVNSEASFILGEDFGSFQIIEGMLYFLLFGGLAAAYRKYKCGELQCPVFKAKEAFLLYAAANILSIFPGVFESTEMNYSFRVSVGILGCGSIVLLAAFLVKNKYASQYREVTILSRQYLELQLKYFEDYKNSQIEIRRFRHDMKNHFLCMDEMVKQKKYAELQQYLDQLSGHSEEIDMDFIVGNHVAEAVINEKYNKMKKESIEFSVDGTFTNHNLPAAMDLCSILANCLDNAIEACKKVEYPAKREIVMSIKSSELHTMLLIENTVKEKVKIQWNRVVSGKNDPLKEAEDTRLHGWGLENTRRLVEKYGGTFHIFCDEEKFWVEIIL